jgi:hypothetical protein
MCRRFGLFNGGSSDHSYQIGMAFTWVVVLSMMIVTQISWGANGAVAAPIVAIVTLGIHVITAFLDFKARTTLEEIPVEYYGLMAEKIEEEDDDVEMARQEGLKKAEQEQPLENV